MTGLVVRIDWFEVTVRGVTFESFQSLVGDLFGGATLYEESHGASGYRRRAKGPEGVTLLWDAPDTAEQERDDYHLTLSGKACAALDIAARRRLLDWCTEHDTKPTRIDLAGDDFDKRVTVGEYVAHYVDGSTVVTAARSWEHIKGSSGESFVLGSRVSAVRLTVYDKNAESGGEVDSVRHELRFRDNAAWAVFLQLQKETEAQVWASRYVAHLDYRDRAASRNVSRCPRMPWFAALVANTARADPYGRPPALTTVDAAKSFITKQIAPLFATVLAAEGGDMAFVSDVMIDGAARMKTRHRWMVDEFRRVRWS